MKYMVISDIHGDLDKLNKVLEIYSKEGCSKLIVLGDLFNYGIDFNRDDIINRLNLMSESIIAVSGNCDRNINGIKFLMPMINNVTLNNKNILITHGHALTREYLSNCNADIILVGHSHMSNIEFINNKLFVNPGSISKSRRGENSFIIIDDEQISIRNIDNIVLDIYKF